MYNMKDVNKTVCETTENGTPQSKKDFHSASKDIKSIDLDDNGALGLTKSVFLNKQRKQSKRSKHSRHEDITPQHEELVEYIHSSWLLFSSIEHEEECTPSTSTGSLDSGPLYYEDEPCSQLKDFKPFELELWWGRRLYNLLTKSAKKNATTKKV